MKYVKPKLCAKVRYALLNETENILQVICSLETMHHSFH